LPSVACTQLGRGPDASLFCSGPTAQRTRNRPVAHYTRATLLRPGPNLGLCRHCAHPPGPKGVQLAVGRSRPSNWIRRCPFISEYQNPTGGRPSPNPSPPFSFPLLPLFSFLSAAHRSDAAAAEVHGE
jgi:hypothetical protein